MCEKFYPESYARFRLTGDVQEVGDKGKLFQLYCRVRGSLGLLADVWSPAQRRAAHKVLESLRPRAVLAHYGPNALKVAGACRKRNIPLFIHFHGYDASSLLRKKDYRYRIRKVLSLTAGVVVVSEAMAETLIGLGVGKEDLAVIPCGVDVTEFPENERPASKRSIFLMVGRLVEKKAPLTSIQAFEMCADNVPEVELRIIGFGPLRQAVDDFVEQSRHADKITILGSRDYDEVRTQLLSADIFVQHSVTAKDGNTEGWPISIAEAAASGLPIVSTRHAGIPMQVKHGQTGFLVEEGDVHHMAKCMEKLASDLDLRRRMGVESRKHIAQVGSIEDSVSRLFDFINERITAREVRTVL